MRSVRVSFEVDVTLAESPSSAAAQSVLSLTGAFWLDDAQQRVGLDVDDAQALGPLLRFIGKRVVRCAVGFDGTLRVECDGSLRLEVPPHARYEAWRLRTPGGYLVAQPGGEVSAWPGDDAARSPEQIVTPSENLRYPGLRANLCDAAWCLKDAAYQASFWQAPRSQPPDNLFMFEDAIAYVLDDMNAGEGGGLIGYVLENESERLLLVALAQALFDVGPKEKYGSVAGRPGWARVRAAAAELYGSLGCSSPFNADQ